MIINLTTITITTVVRMILQRMIMTLPTELRSGASSNNRDNVDINDPMTAVGSGTGGGTASHKAVPLLS